MTLTKRQLELLQRIADGETPKGIAEQEGKYLSTIEITLQRARRALGVHTTVHAVAAAMRKEWIE